MGKLYDEKYIIKSNDFETRYMTRIKREALKNKLHGYVEEIDGQTLELKVVGTNQSIIDDFFTFCKKGYKKTIITDVTRNQIETKENDIFKIGFEIVKQ